MSTSIVTMASVLTAAATVLTAFAFFYAAFVTRKQLRIMHAQHVREAADKAFEEFDSDSVRAARAYIFNSDLPTDVDALTGAQLEAVEKVGLVIERMGFLVETGLINPPELVFTRLCGAILRCDAKIGPYLEQERVRRNDPEHFSYYEKLVERAWQYWRSKHGEELPASFTRKL
ncbi:MAG: DUF4760 domain-containing protein [Actinobacteria bacterium]|nr:DUF4760 domain-containing protein [Actinomycetota bacterium]